jgi:hypothetical protein
VLGIVAANLRASHKNEVLKAEIKTCAEFWKDQPIQLAKAV